MQLAETLSSTNNQTPKSILVVLYGCKLEDSLTIKSLVSHQGSFPNFILCIWNNGPTPIEKNHDLTKALSEKGFKLEFRETTNNLPLSWIYNKFIEDFPANSFTILDHDSNLPRDFLAHIESPNKSFIEIPIVRHKGENIAPSLYGKFTPPPYGCSERIISIGSGLTISDTAAKKIKQKYSAVFDENFALYGVDTTFFIRITDLELADKIELAPHIDHSFSRLEDESPALRKFRKTERGYDLGLTLHHYPSARLILYLIKQTMLSLLNMNNASIPHAIQCIITGKHKRCISEKINEH